MARNGSGTFSLLATVAPANTVSSSTTVNSVMDDIATGLTDSINVDGTKAWEANQSVGGFKLTSLGAGTLAGDAAQLSQVQTGVVQHSTAVAGTADAIQVTLSPASTSLTTNEVIRWKSGGANTVGAPTLSKDAGTTNKTIKKGAGAALAVGDTGASGYECQALYNGTDWILQNPATDGQAASESAAGLVELATTAEAAALTDTARAVTAAGLAAAMAGKKAIWIDASAMRPKAANGAGFSDYDSGASDVTLRCADFDTTTQEYAQFKLAMPEIWNEGTVTFKPYWTNTAGLTTETVVFSLAGLALGNDDAINASFGTVQTSTDTWIAQNDLHIGPESSAITIAGTPASGDLVVFEVSRVVASDNLTGDARLIGLMLYVTTNAFNEA